MGRFRSRSSTSFSRPVKRATDWVIQAETSAYVTIANDSKVLVGGVSAAQLAVFAPATVVRTRGLLTIASDQAGADEQQLGAFGMTFVNETARALGVTGIPGPSEDALWDGWFVHQFFAQKLEFSSGVGFEPNMATQYSIDSKAMRKFESDEGLAFMIENSHATFDLQMSLQLRILIKAG